MSPAPCCNNELLVFSAIRSSSRTGFRLPLEEARKEADFLPAWGNLSMTMWKQTQSVRAPSFPEPVLPCNQSFITRTKKYSSQKDTSSTCEFKLYKCALGVHRRTIGVALPLKAGAPNHALMSRAATAFWSSTSPLCQQLGPAGTSCWLEHSERRAAKSQGFPR